MNFKRNKWVVLWALLVFGEVMGGCSQPSTSATAANPVAKSGELQIQADKLLNEMTALSQAERGNRLAAAPDVRRFIQSDPVRSRRLRTLMSAK